MRIRIAITERSATDSEWLERSEKIGLKMKPTPSSLDISTTKMLLGLALLHDDLMAIN